ncbi:hypothetical protein V866_007682 [Kwoniella sp. B9012]
MASSNPATHVRINFGLGSTHLGPSTVSRITADTLTEEDRDRIPEIMTAISDECEMFSPVLIGPPSSPQERTITFFPYRGWASTSTHS